METGMDIQEENIRWRPQNVGDPEAKAQVSGTENKEPPWIDTFSESLAGSYGLH